MRAEFARETRDLVEKHKPWFPGIRGRADSQAVNYRKDVAASQKEALRDIKTVSWSEALGDDISKLGEFLTGKTVEGMGIYFQDNGAYGVVFFHKKDDAMEIDKWLILKGEVAIDLVSIFKKWGIKRVILQDKKEETVETHSGQKFTTGADFNPNTKEINIYGVDNLIFSPHEAGHGLQHRDGIKRIDEDGKYQRLLATNIIERNADAFFFTVARICRDLGVPIVDDQFLYRHAKNRRVARVKSDSYIK